MKDLKHENIVEFIEQFVDVEQGKLFIVLGLCDDCNLTQYAERLKE